MLFPETWSKCGGNCTKYKTTVVDLDKILVRVPWGHLGLKNTPFWGCFFQICRIIDMHVVLVVFHGAELKNKCFNTWNCTVCPFSVGITTLEAFLGLNQGGGGMLDLEFFKKKFFFRKKFFAPKFIFLWCWLHFHFFFFWSILGGGWGELRLSRFSDIFDFLLIS